MSKWILDMSPGVVDAMHSNSCIRWLRIVDACVGVICYLQVWAGGQDLQGADVWQQVVCC